MTEGNGLRKNVHSCAERTAARVVIRLGLNDESKRAEPRVETETVPPKADPVGSLDEAIRQLELLETEAAEPSLAPEAAVVREPVPEDVAQAVVYWLTRYSRNSSETARNIRELAARSPERVVETVLHLYQGGGWGEAARFLASVLSGNGRTAAKLCDPSASLDSSVGIAKALTQHEPRFDARFAKSLLVDDQMTEAERQRGLAVLERLDGGGRLIPILMQFLRDPDSRIRSKAALMFGRIMSTHGLLDRLMGDTDARVRANLVEGLWNSTAGDDRRPLFRRALQDPNHRVVGNALVGLHRLGEHRDVIQHVTKMARRPEAPFRATAAWVMGQTGEERYAAVLRHMVRDPDLLVRRGAFRSLRRINTMCAAQNASEGQPEAQAG